MAAATSWGGGVSGGGRGSVRVGRADDDPATRTEALSLRLPASDVSALRFLFGGPGEPSGLESMVGLASNFGTMCQRMAESTVIGSSETARGRAVVPGTRNRARVDVAIRGDGHTSGGAEADRVERFESGSGGFEGQRIHIHTGHAPYRVDQLTSIEAWACWSNHTTGGRNEPRGRQADVAYHTLIEMVERDQKRHVVTLYLMYSGATPVSRRSDFGRDDSHGLGDLVPLALETDTVLRHTKRMTLELRRSLTERFAQNRMVDVDASSRRPCRCPVHSAEDCPQRELPGFEDTGCECKGPAPHLWMLCPNRDAAQSTDPAKQAAEQAAARLAEGAHAHWLTVRGRVDRTETVSPLEALHDLLDPLAPLRGQLSLADHRAEQSRHNAVRAVRAADIRVEAHQMLVQASKSYRSAKARVTR